MTAPVVGMAYQIETRVTLDPGRRTVPGLRLWLLSPDGRRSVIDRFAMTDVDLDAQTATVRAEPVLKAPGLWEWQFEDGSGRVLDHGRVRVRPTGFAR